MDCSLLYLALTAFSQMFKMWSLGSTTSDPHSTPTADSLHLHLGIHVQLQSADWFKKNIDLVITCGAKTKGQMQYFINQWHLGTKTTSGLFPATRDLLSHGQPLSHREEQRAPESWRQRSLPAGVQCWGVQLISHHRSQSMKKSPHN